MKNREQIRGRGRNYDHAGVPYVATVSVDGELYIVDVEYEAGDPFKLRRTFTKREYLAEFLREL